MQQVPLPTDQSDATAPPTYSDSTLVLAAGKHYQRSRLHTFFYGSHYRKAWTTPVTIPVLDIGTAKGGLTPVKQGGSRQTLNLRLQDSLGTEYVLRSVDKEPASALPEKWQKSYVANIIRDATSATHPYAALTLPPMAAAVGIYHVVPELVYVPHDPMLGEHLPNIGGMVAMLEKRPAGNQKHDPLMGNAKKVKSTRSMLEDRLLDNDTQVDARYFLRARLFDMLIGDWSRHEDNWRWARFKTEEGNLYKAVPRDRDNVYYKLNDAVIPWLFMRLGVKQHFQTYRKNLRKVEDLNRSGRNLDEILLAGLSYKDWQEVADSVQQALTDEVIDQAFRQMPDTIYQLTASRIIDKLKSRRDQLPQIAKDYFEEVSDNAFVVGTDKKELFEVEVLSREEVRVRMYKIRKKDKGNLLLFDRTFHSDVTKEIQLFGLDGDDEFKITGNLKPRINIKVYGGAGADSYTVAAADSKLGKKVYIEDSKYRNTYHIDKKTKVVVNDTPPATMFDGKGWLLRYYLN